jgi:hypothetical protein
MHVQRGVRRLFLSNISPEGKEGFTAVLERDKAWKCESIPTPTDGVVSCPTA